MRSTTYSEVANWLASAITSCQPLDHQHVEAINALLPGVETLAVALPVVLDKKDHHILQTCFNLNPEHQPCTGRSAIFSNHEPLLASTVYGSGKALLCPASKSDTFEDVKSLVKDATYSSVACLPLHYVAASSPEQYVSSTTSTQGNNRPFGSFCIALKHDIIPKETVAAAHSLSRALALDHGHTLRSHAMTIISCLNAPLHSSPAESDTEEEEDEEDADVLIHDNKDNMNENLDNEASCSRSSGPSTLDRTQEERPLSSSSSPPPSRSFWMTFKDSALEKSYLDWSAQHMRCLDPAAILFVCIYFCAIGFSPSFKMALNNPLVWTAGWTVLLPIGLCMLPGINHNIYMGHRERCLLVFHAIAIAWQVSTANTTKYLGPSLFIQISNNPAACFAWQFLNLVMFQVRWKYVLGISFAMLVLDTIPLAPGLCKLFEEHQHLTAGRNTECVQATIFYGAALVFAAVVVLRVNESRMRRLFLNSYSVDDKKKK